MRRRQKTRKRKKNDDTPDWFDKGVTEPAELDELMDIERNMTKIRYAVAIGRFKISKKHSIKEYAV